MSNSLGTTPATNYPGLALPEQRDPQAPVPFWDAPLTTLEPGETLDAWSTVKLAGILAPGKALVQCRKGKQFDIKKGKGQKIATVTFTGYDLAEVLITLFIWDRPQLNRLWALVPYLQPPPKPPSAAQAANWPPPVDIDHPALHMLGVTAVHIQHIGALEPSTPKGVWMMRLTCLEYKKAAGTDNVASTPTGALDLGSVPTAIQANPQSFLPPAADTLNPNAT